MELKQNKSEIQIIGNDEYLDLNDTTISYGSYRRIDSVTLDILIALDHNSNIKKIKYGVDLHSDPNYNNTLKLDYDGLFRIVHYVLPIKEWIERSQLLIDMYYYDNGKLYSRINNIDTEITIETLLLQEDLQLDDKIIFSDYYIKRCFSEIAKKIISIQAECKTLGLEQLKEQRDLISMFIHVIKYSLEFNKPLEAQLYIEKFFKCNTICNKPISDITNYDCGCK